MLRKNNKVRSIILALAVVCFLSFVLSTPVPYMVYSADDASTQIFSDVPADHWASKFINALAHIGYIKGMGDGTFGVDLNTTRAEFVTLMVRVSGEDLVTYKGVFTDVSADKWYAQYVETAFNLGMINGTGEGRFEPDANIKRQEVTTIIANTIAAYQNTSVADLAGEYELNFSDTSNEWAAENNWAVDGIRVCAQLGIVSSKPEAAFNPLDFISRAEVATVTYNFVDFFAGTSSPTPSPAGYIPGKGSAIAKPDPSASMNLDFSPNKRGTNLWQCQLTGSWSGDSVIRNGGLIPGDNIQYKIEGTRVKLAAEVQYDGGMIDVSVLDSNNNIVPGSERTLDLYGIHYGTPQIVYDMSFNYGYYTLKVAKHNGKNPAKTTQVDETCLYWIDVYGAKIITPAPTPTPMTTDIYVTTPHPITKRQFTVASTSAKIRLKSKEKNLKEILRLVDETAKGCSPDMITFSEGVYTRGNPGTIEANHEAVPGPLYNALAEKCRQYNCYIVYNFNEARSDGKYYDTTYILDRQGKIVGNYDKYYPTSGEQKFPYLFSPGTTFPVFQTEFGMIGMEICYDADPINNNVVAKGLKANGAEVIIVSSMGDYTYNMKQQSKDLGFWTVFCGSDKYETGNKDFDTSCIIDPQGNIVAGVTDDSCMSTYYVPFVPGVSGSYTYYTIDLGPIPTKAPASTPMP